MPNELVVICDGTSDAPERGLPTNPQIMRELLGAGLVGTKRIAANLPAGWEIDQYKNRIVYYDRGLGSAKLNSQGQVLSWSWRPTSFFKNASLIYNKFRETGEQIVASGIIDNVAQAYRYLVMNYTPGDKIYLFGFSRGAYTLRLLATVIRYIGLIDRNKYGNDLARINTAIETAFNLYQINIHPDQDHNAAKAFRLANSYQGVAQIVHFIGLWDTVPGKVMEKVHADYKLSSIVANAFQVLPIDERRNIFLPLLWISSSKTNSEQIWIPGSHSNSGGGLPSQGLSNLALNYIATKAIECGLHINPESLARYVPNPLDAQQDSYNSPMAGGLQWSAVCSKVRRKVLQFSDDERLDPSVAIRYGKTIKIEPNITAVYVPTSITHLFRAYKNTLKSELPGLPTSLPDSDTLSDVGERALQARIS